MIAVGKTDIGRSRTVNQDNIYVSCVPVGCVPNVFVVADGMGGELAGDVASDMAIKSFISSLSERTANGEYLDNLISAVTAANSDVYNKGNSSPAYNGMGTTFLAVTIAGNVLYAAHVGDSRLYAITEKKIEQLSNDHSYVMEMVRNGQLTQEEAEHHPRKNVITRAVGSAGLVNVDGIIRPVAHDTVYLICSDGLSNMVSADEIKSIVSNKNISIEKRVDTLIARANENGGKDNISAVIISPWEDGEAEL
ncbi:MAG: Stp1/IreP family PP2C-type Ser/Thr phosphatase [Firmicutes bacterium]|nr:Stp1/IreP family PP2C-type Ser/Thr phosphatase [Bacillota bacterium]